MRGWIIRRFASAASDTRVTRCAMVLGLHLLTVLSALPVLAGCAPDRGTIGAVLAQTPDQRLVLRDVPPALAAGRAGLQPGDEILLIDGRDVRELDERGVHRALSGSVGDPVKLTLLRQGRVVRVTVRRTSPPPRRRGG